MGNCTYGRPADGHAITDVENAIVEAVFRLREKFGSIKKAQESMVEATNDRFFEKTMETYQLTDFLFCLAELEIKNPKVFDDIHYELKSYRDVLPEH